MRKILFLVTAAVFFGAVTFQAQTLNPALVFGGRHAGKGGPRHASVMPIPVDPNLYVCNGCTSPPSAPHIIDPSNITISFAPANGTVTSDVFVILGVPNGTSAPTITCNAGCSTGQVSEVGTATMTASAITAGGTGGATGFGVSTTKSPINAYEGFSNITCCSVGQNSENFTNWSTNTTEFPNNPDNGVTSFTLYEYDLGSDSTAAVNGSAGSLNISVSGAPSGTWVIAYATGTAPCGKKTCTALFATPFTTSGQTGKVPEHATVTLLGAGLLGLAGLFGRRKKQVK
jgi:LPXTG-motif cell wall-anchored protein